MSMQVYIGATADAFVEMLLKGDIRCAIEIGARVKKVLPDEGDVIPLGSPGTVLGSAHLEGPGDVYLVQYDCFIGPSVTRGIRIGRL